MGQSASQKERRGQSQSLDGLKKAGKFGELRRQMKSYNQDQPSLSKTQVQRKHERLVKIFKNLGTRYLQKFPERTGNRFFFLHYHHHQHIAHELANHENYIERIEEAKDVKGKIIYNVNINVQTGAQTQGSTKKNYIYHSEPAMWKEVIKIIFNAPSVQKVSSSHHSYGWLVTRFLELFNIRFKCEVQPFYTGTSLKGPKVRTKTGIMLKGELTNIIDSKLPKNPSMTSASTS